ncbi:DASH complex subunit Ask1-domain-containing protein [Phyllosticta citrichinensis]|uniref:DASH complex subunit ASK1 n=1 Tax=Phyllosticta citrichinensis TaxID=1130410 RepID=A0ABR1XLG7_9PEZI
MSRPSSMMAQRNLTLTEELERLEQSITLTLQEIDHNFSRAHRIVTGSILPIVEEYAKHSEAVWEGSKFWKQFFEASANVSLSGYEEPSGGEDTTIQHDETTQESAYDESPSVRDTTIHSNAGRTSKFDDSADLEADDSILSSPSLTKTPRNPPTMTAAAFADYGSPYEALRQELRGGDGDTKKEGGAKQAENDNDGFSSDGAGDLDEGTVMNLPTTPGRPSTSGLPDMSMTPQSSPFDQHTQTHRPTGNQDPLLHRMLDRTYRIAATPHTARKNQQSQQQQRHPDATPGTANRTRRLTALDSSPLSSPEGAAPQLRAEMFSSPMKSPMKTPCTPGVSVLHQQRQQHRTPGTAAASSSKGKGKASEQPVERTLDFTRDDLVTWDSDSEDGTQAMSPPKTLQFHVPQSRLLQTPAREASRRIVEDLLLTAGGGDALTDSNVDMGEVSPSVVRRHEMLDDSF